ncbi:MAG: hypothetical protein ACYCZT_10310 [Thiobacillus sp.]
MDSMNPGFTVHNASVINYVGTDPLPRDQTQSLRLHEPTWMLSSIDPITGRDIDNLSSHPSIVDGNMTMYFESDETRQAYIDTPKDHPFHLVDNPTDEGYDEG